jgi:hypothetical protein
MLHPGLADLLKTLVVVRASAHSIKIVRNDRMVRGGHFKKIHQLVSGVADRCAHAEADLSAAASKLNEASCLADISRNEIGTRIENFRDSRFQSGRRLSRAIAQKKKERERDPGQRDPSDANG